MTLPESRDAAYRKLREADPAAFDAADFDESEEYEQEDDELAGIGEDYESELELLLQKH